MMWWVAERGKSRRLVVSHDAAAAATAYAGWLEPFPKGACRRVVVRRFPFGRRRSFDVTTTGAFCQAVRA